jgi:YD repeat-containing protein
MSRKRVALIVAAAVLASSTAAHAAEIIVYTYDARGRLIKVERDPASTVNADVETCYTLDKADNRKKVKTTTSTPLPTCPAS